MKNLVILILVFVIIPFVAFGQEGWQRPQPINAQQNQQNNVQPGDIQVQDRQDVQEDRQRTTQPSGAQNSEEHTPFMSDVRLYLSLGSMSPIKYKLSGQETDNRGNIGVHVQVFPHEFIGLGGSIMFNAIEDKRWVDAKIEHANAYWDILGFLRYQHKPIELYAGAGFIFVSSAVRFTEYGYGSMSGSETGAGIVFEMGGRIFLGEQFNIGLMYKYVGISDIHYDLGNGWYTELNVGGSIFALTLGISF